VGGTGSFSGSSVVGGKTSGSVNFGLGSAYGEDLFLGADVTFQIAPGQTLGLNNLGGAGNLADPNVIGNDPNAQGGLILQGGGNLSLAGSANFYSGRTLVNNGTLLLADGASETGTSSVVIGENSGDHAVFRLGSGSTLVLGGFNGQSGTDQPIVLAQNPGSIGLLQIGNGTGSNGAFLGARVISGGAGNATVQFSQNFAAEGGNATVYPFYTTLNGSLTVIQAGPGTTLFQPLYGNNSYSGGTVINQGTLQLGADNALPLGGEVIVASGATFDLNSFSQSTGQVMLNGGTILSSHGNGSFSPTALTTQSGTVNASISGSTGLVQQGNGTTTLSAANNFTGLTLVESGSLVAAGIGTLGSTDEVVISSAGTLVLAISDSVNDLAAISLNGGTLATTGDVVWEDLGATTITEASVLDLQSENSDLVFASLTLDAPLQIWNWGIEGNNMLSVQQARVYGNLAYLQFYEDSGVTFLGPGAIDGNRLYPVLIPEPRAASLAALGLALAALAARRKRTPPARTRP
jgi:autotransporter-associated beta strand protein